MYVNVSSISKFILMYAVNKVTYLEAQMYELQTLRDCLSHASGMIKVN